MHLAVCMPAGCAVSCHHELPKDTQQQTKEACTQVHKMYMGQTAAIDSSGSSTRSWHSRPAPCQGASGERRNISSSKQHCWQQLSRYVTKGFSSAVMQAWAS
jgi:hypothetical protein